MTCFLSFMLASTFFLACLILSSLSFNVNSVGISDAGSSDPSSGSWLRMRSRISIRLRQARIRSRAIWRIERAMRKANVASKKYRSAQRRREVGGSAVAKREANHEGRNDSGPAPCSFYKGKGKLGKCEGVGKKEEKAYKVLREFGVESIQDNGEDLHLEREGLDTAAEVHLEPISLDKGDDDPEGFLRGECVSDTFLARV